MCHLIVLLLRCWSHFPFQSSPFQVKANSRIKRMDILLHLQVTRLSGANAIASSASSYLFIDLFYTSIVVWGFWRDRKRDRDGKEARFLFSSHLIELQTASFQQQRRKHSATASVYTTVLILFIYIRQPTGLL